MVAEINTASKAVTKRKSAGDQTRSNLSTGGGSEREEPMDVDVTVSTKRVRQNAPVADGHGVIDVNLERRRKMYKLGKLQLEIGDISPRTDMLCGHEHVGYRWVSHIRAR
jgi:hypothetical protein